MSFPRRKDKFVQWSKAMVEGATVDKPSYPGTKNPSKKSSTSSRMRKRRKRKNRAKKD